MAEELKDLILKSRKISSDNSLVTYDLSVGIKFSRHKKVSEQLAEVFFFQDAIKWYKPGKEDIIFKPTYKAEIILPNPVTKDVEKVVLKFIDVLRDKVIKNAFADWINKAKDYHATMGQTALFGFATSAAWQELTRRGLDRDYRADIVQEIMSNTKIKESGN